MVREVEREEAREIQETIAELIQRDDSVVVAKDNLLPDVYLLCENLLKTLKVVKASETKDARSTAPNNAASRDPNFIRTSIANYNNKSAPCVCIRDVLGTMDAETISKLVLLLTDLMSSRVDLDALLPATQDELANQEAMGKSAITLTREAFLAAELYVELLGMPGAWAAGLVDVGAVSGLSALLRRWSLECSGLARQELVELSGESHKRKSSTKSKGDPPVKRSREKSARRSVVADLSDDEDFDTGQDDEESLVELTTEEPINDSPILSPRELVLLGLKVSGSVADILCQRDFMRLSPESREALIDSAITSLLASSSITLAGAKPSKKQSQDKVVAHLGNAAVSALSHALKTCLSIALHDLEGATGSQSSMTTETHETSVYILRGLLPCLSLQMDLPNGQDGREAAQGIATSTLAAIVETVSKDYNTISQRESTPDPLGTTTPMQVATTPATGRKGRKKRVSFGGVGEASEEKQAPTLKNSSTPARQRLRLSGGLTPIQMHGRPRPILSAVIGLLQKLATLKGMDRALVRNLVIDVIAVCLPHLPYLERACYLRFLLQLCHSKVSVHRLTATELTGKILSEEWFWKNYASDENTPSESTPKTPMSCRSTCFSPIIESSAENMPLAILKALHGRLLDRSPAVRARSAYCFSEVIQKVSSSDSSFDDSCLVSFTNTLDMVASDVAHTLRKRASVDERATVRKAAVMALVEVLSMGGETSPRTSELDISALSQLCSDSSVATRKAAADGLTHLLKISKVATHDKAKETTELLERAWTNSVLPLVMDTEPSCVGRTVDLFVSVVVEPVVLERGQETDSANEKASRASAWRLLSIVSASSRQHGATRGEIGALKVMLGKLEQTYEETVFKQFVLEARDVLSSIFVDCNTEDVSFLYNEESNAEALGVWCLFDALTDREKELPALSKLIKKGTLDPAFLVSSWGKLREMSLQSVDESGLQKIYPCMQSCIRVLAKLARHLSDTEATQLAEEMKSLLRNFSIPAELVGAAMAGLVAFTQRVSDGSSTSVRQECSNWIKEISQSCEDEIASFVSKPSTESTAESRLVRALFVAGELCMIGFSSDESSISGSVISQTGRVGGDSLAGLHVRPSARLLRLVQAILPKHLPVSECSDNEAALTPTTARAHAFVALGKMCLRDEALAKECLTILARELHQNMSDKCTPVQSNALLVLGDLCVKYTNLVDRYLPVMAACLQSGSTDSESYALFDTALESTALVRKHAVLLLSSLLLQDYIKWRGLLFHRFLVASADDDEGVSKLAEMTLTGPLLTKQPKLFFNNFVESFFVLNRCTAHPVYAAAAASGDNGAGITVGFDGINLTGAAGRAKRLRMYEMMLAQMSDEEKIGISARIAKDVLGAAVESNGDLARACRRSSLSSTPGRNGVKSEDNAFNVLSDAFVVLTSPSLRVGRRSEADGETEVDVGLDGKEAQVALAKGKLLSKISRKHLIEIVLPILCKLKTQLQESCSPLLKELMRYMVEMFRVYKAEVRDFLADDPTLLQEVEYDARQFQKAQKMLIESPAPSVVSN